MLPLSSSLGFEDDALSQVTTMPCDVSMTTVVPAAEEDENMNTSLVQEIIRDLQSKHLAEKQVLEKDILCYRQVVQRLVCKYKALWKQKQKQDISLMLMSKLTDQNNKLKTEQQALSTQNLNLASKFATMKQLTVQYERERLKQFHFAEAAIQQLQAESNPFMLD